MRVGVVRTPFFDNLDPEVARAIEAAIADLRRLTADVIDVQVPAAGNVAAIWNPEIYAYHLPYITTTPELYQTATRNLIQGAGKANAAAYAQARREVDVVRRETSRVQSTWRRKSSLSSALKWRAASASSVSSSQQLLWSKSPPADDTIRFWRKSARIAASGRPSLRSRSRRSRIS